MIRTFYANPRNRIRYKSGILIYPLPDAHFYLREKIYKALEKIGIASTDFILTDRESISEWCKLTGIEPINTDSILGIWTDKDPETCVQIVREVIAKS